MKVDAKACLEFSKMGSTRRWFVRFAEHFKDNVTIVWDGWLYHPVCLAREFEEDGC
jgi:hypothetical protein